MDKRLLRFAGGQPVRSQDLEFLQDALNSSVTHLAKMFGDTYILYGSVDDEKNNVLEGAVVINGEVYKVPALGAIGNNKLCYRAIDSDERTFFNGQLHKVVRTYEAYLSEDISGAIAWIDLKTAKNPVNNINNRFLTIESYIPKMYKHTSMDSGSSGLRTFANFIFDSAVLNNGDMAFFYADFILDDSPTRLSGIIPVGDTASYYTLNGKNVECTLNGTAKNLYISTESGISEAIQATIVITKVDNYE